MHNRHLVLTFGRTCLATRRRLTRKGYRANTEMNSADTSAKNKKTAREMAGHETIAAAMAAPALAWFVARYWEEVLPTVPPPTGADLPAYTRALAKRFLNPAIRHRTAQIAMDGSQKRPQRVLRPVRERLATGLGIRALR